MFRTLAAFFLIAVPVIAPAQSAEDLLFERRDWQVWRWTDAGVAFCSAETTNAQGQTFSVLGDDSEFAVVGIIDPRWTLTPRAVDFVIDIGSNSWDLTGQGEGNSILVPLSDDSETGSFVQWIARGITMSLRNTSGQPLGEFSLMGSRASLDAWLDCWDGIVAARGTVPVNPADPFAPAPGGQPVDNK